MRFFSLGVVLLTTSLRYATALNDSERSLTNLANEEHSQQLISTTISFRQPRIEEAKDLLEKISDPEDGSFGEFLDEKALVRFPSPFRHNRLNINAIRRLSCSLRDRSR